MSTRPAPRAVGAARIVTGAAVIVVLGSTYVLGIAAGRTNLIDYFGYFTNLTSLLMSAVVIGAGAMTLSRTPPPPWFDLARGVGTTCMLLVALIYNVVVPGTGTAPIWVSVILHAVFPAVLAFDWLLVDDRRSLAWRHLWMVTLYPLAWIAVVLVRGATDGWVPYGFLLPSHGPLVLGLHVLGLLTTLIVLGSLVWLASRAQIRSRSVGSGHHVL